MKIFKVLFTSLLIALAVPSISYANLKCFEKPDNYEQGSGIGGFDKEKKTKDGYKEVQDPAQDLLACSLQTVYEGPQSVIKNHCGCVEAVKELCSFKWKNGSLKISASGAAKKAWCVPFASMAF